jgi:hypothetical protein
MVRNCLKTLDSGFRRNDGKWYFLTFYETININYPIKSKSRQEKKYRNSLAFLNFNCFNGGQILTRATV